MEFVHFFNIEQELNLIPLAMLISRKPSIELKKQAIELDSGRLAMDLRTIINSFDQIKLSSQSFSS